MSAHSGPDIVTDGLVLHLDAADIKSYNGSGTTWYDRSGNENHFILNGSPELINGVFAFTDETKYAYKEISRENNPDLVRVNESFSTEIIYKPIQNTIKGKFFGCGNYGVGGWNIGVSDDSFTNFQFQGYNNECDDGVNCRYNRGSIISDTIPKIQTDKFVHFAIVYNMDNLYTYAYLNGQLIGSQYDSTRGTGPTVTNFFIGRNMQGGWTTLYGYCPLVRMYTNVLSNEQILQNYKATKSRFQL